MRTPTKLAAFVGIVGCLMTGSVAGEEVLKAYYRHLNSIELAKAEKQTQTVTSIREKILREPKTPVEISIPRLHVEAAIQPVGLDEAGRMATIPSPKTIAWYAYGAVPGLPGNAILAGHRDWNGVLGTFWGIERLKVHDPVLIRFSDGSEMTFQVVSDNTYLADKVPANVMDPTGPERTTLVTCAGDFVWNEGGYQSRVVVRLEPVK